MAKVGAKPIMIDHGQIEALAAQGLTKKEIAHCLGIGESTLYDKMTQFPEFIESFQKGRSKGIAKVSNVLFQKAIAGDNGCMFFFLERRGEWIKQDTIKHEGEINSNHAVTTTVDIGPGIIEVLLRLGLPVRSRPSIGDTGNGET